MRLSVSSNVTGAAEPPASLMAFDLSALPQHVADPKCEKKLGLYTEPREWIITGLQMLIGQLECSTDNVKIKAGARVKFTTMQVHSVMALPIPIVPVYRHEANMKNEHLTFADEE